MDDEAAARARHRHGVVPRDDVSGQARRDARRRGLREVQLGAYLARTQPYDFWAQLASLHVSHPAAEWTVCGQGALCLLGEAEPPRRLVVGVPLSSELAIRPPVSRRRLVPAVLRGSRVVGGARVAALEIAVVQWAVGRPAPEVLALVERLVRERKTTVSRLRSRLRRGFAGSAAVRAALDELAGGSLEKDVRRLRHALEALGVTGLEPEVHFTNAEGASAYADLLHRPTMTVIEVDAALDHLRRQRFLADRRRDRWMLREHAARTLRVDVVEIREDVMAVARELAWFLLPEVRESAS
jgi:hypothetical protein